MKKVILFGSLFLALGMASCKTYCPAYNYANVETEAPATNPAAEATDVAKG